MVSRQNLAQCPLDTIDRVGNKAHGLLVLDHVGREGDGRQSIANVMIHFRDDLEASDGGLA